MFYKYTVYYKNGNKLSGYAYSERSKEAVRNAIERRSMGDYKIRISEYGEDFPPINSDYILDADR